jgi:hypothetical protein
VQHYVVRPTEGLYDACLKASLHVTYTTRIFHLIFRLAHVAGDKNDVQADGVKAAQTNQKSPPSNLQSLSTNMEKTIGKSLLDTYGPKV